MGFFSKILEKPGMGGAPPQQPRPRLRCSPHRSQPSRSSHNWSSARQRTRRCCIGSATQGVAAPGLASMLDLDRDGNPLDDILEMTRKAIT